MSFHINTHGSVYACLKWFHSVPLAGHFPFSAVTSVSSDTHIIMSLCFIFVGQILRVKFSPTERWEVTL